jgi:glutaredoxin
MSKTVITLYTRKGCHLCDDAKEMIVGLRKNWIFNFEEIDIDENDELTEKYGLMIPVVLVDGIEVGCGLIDYFDVRNHLHEKR